MRSEVNLDGSNDTRDCRELCGSRYVGDCIDKSVVAERDRLRQFVADIRAADAMVVVTRGAAEVRRIVREYDAENAR